MQHFDLNRELHEECGLSVSNELDHVGVLMFEFVNDPVLLEVHVYRTYSYIGTPTETEGIRIINIIISIIIF